MGGCDVTQRRKPEPTAPPSVPPAIEALVARTPGVRAVAAGQRDADGLHGVAIEARDPGAWAALVRHAIEGTPEGAFGERTTHYHAPFEEYAYTPAFTGWHGGRPDTYAQAPLRAPAPLVAAVRAQAQRMACHLPVGGVPRITPVPTGRIIDPAEYAAGSPECAMDFTMARAGRPWVDMLLYGSFACVVEQATLTAYAGAVAALADAIVRAGAALRVRIVYAIVTAAHRAWREKPAPVSETAFALLTTAKAWDAPLDIAALTAMFVWSASLRLGVFAVMDYLPVSWQRVIGRTRGYPAGIDAATWPAVLPAQAPRQQPRIVNVPPLRAREKPDAFGAAWIQARAREAGIDLKVR